MNFRLNRPTFWVAALLFAITNCWPMLANAQAQLLDQITLSGQGLTRGWYAVAPFQGGKYRVVDAKYHSGELFVLTEQGGLTCYDGVKGKVKWSIRVGEPRQLYFPLGVGVEEVAVINGTTLYLVGRTDTQVVDQSEDPLSGSQIATPAGTPAATTPAAASQQKEPATIYKTVATTGRVIFEEKLPHPAKSAPAVTHDGIFVPNMNGSVDRFDSRYNTKIRLMKELMSQGGCAAPPADSVNGVSWMTEKGAIVYASSSGEKINYTYNMNGTASVGTGTRGTAVCGGTNNGEITYINSPVGDPSWTTSIGVGLASSPVLIENDIFVVSKDNRLFNLAAANGALRWEIPAIRQFLARSANKVYSLDEMNRMVITDLKSGTAISSLLVGDTAFSVTNRHSDQIFLVTLDGVIQEIHETAVKTRPNYFVATDEKAEKPKIKVGVEPGKEGGTKPGDAPADNPFATPEGTGPMPATPPKEAANPFAEAEDKSKAAPAPAPAPAPKAEAPAKNPFE